MQSGSTDPELAVRERYTAAARENEAALCCPISYDPRYLEVIPEEILERDYGCGDPTRHVRSGDVVLDLGSGGGKACYIAAQVVGPEGRVIGIDCNEEMLALARRHLGTVARRLGYANVEFRRGLIQDLGLDLERLEGVIRDNPVKTAGDWLGLRTIEERLRRDEPLVPDGSVDCVISNCVLNLVRPGDRVRLFEEAFRVLRRKGRLCVSDIVSDEDVPEHLRRDPTLWSGCISGAHREDLFLKALEDAGFHGITVSERQSKPWQVIEGIEFRSMTVVAYKGKQGPCLERNQAVVYRGPFRRVEDDDGHTFPRGERIAVCDKTYQLLQEEPYEGLFEAIEPRVAIPSSDALAFDCRRSTRRSPRETKGLDYRETNDGEGTCGLGGSCC